MSILLLVLSLLLPAVVLRKQRGYLYGFCFSSVLYFCLVTIWSIIIQIATGSLNHHLIQLTVLGSEVVYVYFQSRNRTQTSLGMSPYTFAAVAAIVIVFVSCIAFNSIRLYNSYGSIPIIGTNDDNANHMAMTVAAIKGHALLFKNHLVDKAVNSGMIIPVTKWYPIGLYANTAHIYHILASSLPMPNRFDLSLLFNLFAVYMPVQLVIFLFLIFQLIDGTYSSKSIASFIFIFTIGLFTVLSEFFLKLFVYGFHAQLVGFNLLLVLFIEGREISRRGHMHAVEMLLISILLFSIGFTYYLFIPIAGAMYFLLHILLKRKMINYVPYAALVLSAIPLLLFNLTQRLDSVNTTYGIAFVSFTGLFVSLIGILVCSLMKDKKDTYMRTVCILVTGLTIVQMVVSTASFFKETNNFGYYFFKSYWTVGFFGLPPLISFISEKLDKLQVRNIYTKYTQTIVMLSLSGLIFFAVFSQEKVDDKGYDLLLHISNGYTNYFPYKMQRKWIAMSNKYGNEDGQNMYVLGKWGQFVLGQFVFGDSPDVTKRLFHNGRWALSKDTVNEYASSIIMDIYNNKPIHIIDNTDFVRKYILFASDNETKKLVEKSKVFGEE